MKLKIIMYSAIIAFILFSNGTMMKIPVVVLLILLFIEREIIEYYRNKIKSHLDNFNDEINRLATAINFDPNSVNYFHDENYSEEKHTIQ